MAALRRRTAVPSMACVWELGGIGVFVSSATQWLRGAFKCCAKETCDVSLWWRCCVLHSSGCSAHWACCLWQYFKKMRRTAFSSSRFWSVIVANSLFLPLAPRSKLGSSNWPLACSVFKGKTVKITALRLWRRDQGLELLCWCVLMCAGVCWCHLHVSAVVPRVRSAVSGWLWRMPARWCF